MFESLLLADPLFAQAALTWSTETYYALCGLVHMIVILVGFRLMGVDPEHNSFIGAVLAAAVINVAAYFLRDQGVMGVIIVGGVIFGLLAAVSSGEVLKSFFMGFIVIAMYGVIGMVVLPRTPLELDQVNGLTRVVMTGGLEAEPITERDAQEIIK